MKAWVRFVVLAVATFAVVAVIGALLLPPGVISSLPVSIAALLIAWPVAYWLTYQRPFESIRN